MPAIFDLLMEEENPAVLVVLGHFIFVYIHPYFDGNARMGSFIIKTL
jgi:Fic family protein